MILDRGRFFGNLSFIRNKKTSVAMYIIFILLCKAFENYSFRLQCWKRLLKWTNWREYNKKHNSKCDQQFIKIYNNCDIIFRKTKQYYNKYVSWTIQETKHLNILRKRMKKKNVYRYKVKSMKHWITYNLYWIGGMIKTSVFIENEVHFHPLGVL